MIKYSGTFIFSGEVSLVANYGMSPNAYIEIMGNDGVLFKSGIPKKILAGKKINEGDFITVKGHFERKYSTSDYRVRKSFDVYNIIDEIC